MITCDRCNNQVSVQEYKSNLPAPYDPLESIACRSCFEIWKKGVDKIRIEMNKQHKLMIDNWHCEWLKGQDG